MMKQTPLAWLGAMAACAVCIHSPAQESKHVPPDPPQLEIGDMPYHEMAEMMDMDDTSRYGKVIVDQAERRGAEEGNEWVWDAKAWFGGDLNKLLLRTEGERVDRETQEARVELLWDRVISRWWSFQAGAREDFGEGPSRAWAAVGLEGLSPFWFEVEATLYAGEQSRTAAQVKIERDVLITQRWILQPELEANFYGKSDPERRIGSGFSDLDVGLRLRYEIRREIAPYLGVAWQRSFGNTADLARAEGEDAGDLQFIAGIRAWF